MTQTMNLMGHAWKWGVEVMCWKKEKGRAAYVLSGCGESWVGGVEMEEGEGLKEDEEEEEEEEGQSWSEQSQPPSQKYHFVTQAPPLTSWQLLPAWLQHSSAHPITLTFLSTKMHAFTVQRYRYGSIKAR